MLGAKQLFCKYAAPLHFSPFSWDGRRLPCNNEGVLSLPTDRCPTGHPQASLRPNAKTFGWRCARRWLQRPWSRCLGEFHGWGWDKTPVPMQEIHGPWFHRASSASLLDINHAVQSKSQVVAVDNLWLCVAITLGMALVTGLAQPFAQPQMNVLQSACFACA